MVKLADEAKTQLEIINSNKIQTLATEIINDSGETPFTQFEKKAFKTAGPGGFLQKDAVLDKMHQMRLTTFENRINDPMNVKPYLPMLSSDEKEVIMEQYYASKKKLSKG